MRLVSIDVILNEIHTMGTVDHSGNRDFTVKFAVRSDARKVKKHISLARLVSIKVSTQVFQHPSNPRPVREQSEHAESSEHGERFALAREK